MAIRKRKGRSKMSKSKKSSFHVLMNAMEDYLSLASKLLPRNAQPGYEEPVKELQKIIKGIIDVDMKNARKISYVVDEHSLRRLDEKIDQLRAVEMTRAMTKTLRKSSK